MRWSSSHALQPRRPLPTAPAFPPAAPAAAATLRPSADAGVGGGQGAAGGAARPLQRATARRPIISSARTARRRRPPPRTPSRRLATMSRKPTLGGAGRRRRGRRRAGRGGSRANTSVHEVVRPPAGAPRDPTAAVEPRSERAKSAQGPRRRAAAGACTMRLRRLRRARGRPAPNHAATTPRRTLLFTGCQTRCLGGDEGGRAARACGGTPSPRPQHHAPWPKPWRRPGARPRRGRWRCGGRTWW
jgi:hypothetical protein